MNIFWNSWEYYSQSKKTDHINNHFYLTDYSLNSIGQKIDQINIIPTHKEQDFNFINNVKTYFPKIKINYLGELDLCDMFISKADNFIQDTTKVQNVTSIYLKNKLVNKDKNIFFSKYKIHSRPIFSKASRFSKDDWKVSENTLSKEFGNVISLRQNSYNDIMCTVDNTIVVYDPQLDLSKSLNLLPTFSFTPKNFLDKLKTNKYKEFYYNKNFDNSQLEKNIKWKFSEEKKSVIYNMDINEVSSESGSIFNNSAENYFYEKAKVNKSFYVGKYLFLECADFSHSEVIIKTNGEAKLFRKIGYNNNLAKLELINSTK